MTAGQYSLFPTDVENDIIQESEIRQKLDVTIPSENTRLITGYMTYAYKRILGLAEKYKSQMSRFLRDMIAIPSESCNEKDIVLNAFDRRICPGGSLRRLELAVHHQGIEYQTGICRTN
jgi:hypothetical protein